MKTIAKILLPVIFGLSFLTGCGSDATPDRPADQNGVYELNGDVYGDVTKVNVDGTECVVYEGSSAGGISCDWSE